MTAGKSSEGDCSVPRAVFRRALDSIALGVLVVDRSLTVAYSNAYARRILALADPATARMRRLGRINSDLGPHLYRLADRALNGANGELQAEAIRLQSSAHPLEVVALATDDEPPVAIIFLRDHAVPNDDGAVLFSHLYQLTPSEAKTALSLVAERSLAETAAALAVSKATTRSHVKGLLRKTGTRRQAELVSRIAAGLANWLRPLEGPENRAGIRSGRRTTPGRSKAQRRSRASSPDAESTEKKETPPR